MSSPKVKATGNIQKPAGTLPLKGVSPAPFGNKGRRPGEQRKPRQVPGTTAHTPKQEAGDAGHGLISLLEIEAEAREARTLLDLHYIIANQTPKLTKARQVFVFQNRNRKQM